MQNVKIVLQEMSMKPIKNKEFGEVYDEILNNPQSMDSSRFYFSVAKNRIGIPQTKIIHAWKEHKTTKEQWYQFINNWNKCVAVCESKSRYDFDNVCYLMLYKINDRYFGAVLANCKKRWYVGTWFEGEKSRILTWMKDKGKTPPEVPTATNVPGFPLNEVFSTNSIHYFGEDFNLYLKNLNELTNRLKHVILY